MKLQTSITTLFLIALCLPTLAAPRNKTQSEMPLTRQLLDLEKKFADAQQHHDRDYVNNAITNDFVSISNNGEAQTKADILSDVVSDNRQEYRIYNAQVVPVNDGAAVVTYDVIVRMVHYDEDTPRYQHVSSVWVKQGSDWKLKFRQATPTELRH